MLSNVLGSLVNVWSQSFVRGISQNINSIIDLPWNTPSHILVSSSHLFKKKNRKETILVFEHTIFSKSTALLSFQNFMLLVPPLWACLNYRSIALKGVDSFFSWNDTCELCKFLVHLHPTVSGLCIFQFGTEFLKPSLFGAAAQSFEWLFKTFFFFFWAM